uniref:RING-type domain-containing protein n=1 Tax=Cryptomonas curvata TaxID=233186 RepID=A0A7S0QQ73_9CRYP|mmetsp:Transcript_49381/g.103028  ORF Transcript_49381/g.103028 Transcript_49381/m.103028 type:complete len:160 (+) Transcript_49381:2-481(+)
MDSQGEAVVVIDSEESARPNSERSNKRRPRHSDDNGVAVAASSRRRPVGESHASIVDLTSVCDDTVAVVESRSSGSKKMKASPEVSAIPEERGDLPAEIHCLICHKDMENPSSTKCGHLFCDRCIRLQLKSKKECPSCHKKAEARDLRKVFLSFDTGSL